MNNIHLLGVSQDTIAVIFDLLKETKENVHFFLHPNMEKKIIPLTPLKEIEYSILPLNSILKKTDTVFFGLSSPKNKSKSTLR